MAHRGRVAVGAIVAVFAVVVLSVAGFYGGGALTGAKAAEVVPGATTGSPGQSSIPSAVPSPTPIAFAVPTTCEATRTSGFRDKMLADENLTPYVYSAEELNGRPNYRSAFLQQLMVFADPFGCEWADKDDPDFGGPILETLITRLSVEQREGLDAFFDDSEYDCRDAQAGGTICVAAYDNDRGRIVEYHYFGAGIWIAETQVRGEVVGSIDDLIAAITMGATS